MLIYTYSPESEEGSDLFQIKIGLLTSKLGIALTKCNNHHLSQLREYQKELQELFATHSQRVFRRVIYFKWSKRLEPIQRPFGPRECGNLNCGPFSASSWHPVNQLRDPDGAGVGRVGGCRAQSVQPNGGRSLSLSSRERLRC